MAEGKNIKIIDHGFESIVEVPLFNLMVLKFNDSPSPTFPGGWAQKASRFGLGLTVIRSDQCPYIPDATNTVLKFSQERGIKSHVVELNSSHDVRNLALSPYRVFSIVYNGRLLAYHYLLPKDLVKMLDKKELHK